jgi:hypothetical protein
MLDARKDDGFRGALRAFAASVAREASTFYWRHAGIVAFLSLAGFTIAFLAIAQLRPIYNWDALPYIAASVRDQFGSAEQIHQHAYSILQQATSVEEFTELTQLDAYRHRQFTDATAFMSMLGMYEIKWLYISLLQVLERLVGPLAAFDAINAVAVIILSVSIGLWLRATRLSGFAPLVVALMFVLQLQGFAVTQQPDFLGNALLIAALLSYDRERNWLGSALLFLAILTRPDQIAVAGILMALAWYLGDRNIRIFALTFAVSFVCWRIADHSVHSIGWWPHFWFSTYQIQEDMTNFRPDFSLKVYVTAIGLNLYRSLFHNTWLAAYVVALSLGVRIYFRHAVPDVRSQVLLLTCLLSVAAKYVIFPLHDGRIYFAPLFVFFLIALKVVSNASASAPVRER